MLDSIKCLKKNALKSNSCFLYLHLVWFGWYVESVLVRINKITCGPLIMPHPDVESMDWKKEFIFFIFSVRIRQMTKEFTFARQKMISEKFDQNRLLWHLDSLESSSFGDKMRSDLIPNFATVTLYKMFRKNAC